MLFYNFSVVEQVLATGVINVAQQMKIKVPFYR